MIPPEQSHMVRFVWWFLPSWTIARGPFCLMIPHEQSKMVNFVWWSLRNNHTWSISSGKIAHAPFIFMILQEQSYMVHFVWWSLTYGPFHLMIPSEQSHMVHFVAGWWQSRYDKINHSRLGLLQATALVKSRTCHLEGYTLRNILFVHSEEIFL